VNKTPMAGVLHDARNTDLEGFEEHVGCWEKATSSAVIHAI